MQAIINELPEKECEAVLKIENWKKHGGHNIQIRSQLYKKQQVAIGTSEIVSISAKIQLHRAFQDDWYW